MTDIQEKASWEEEVNDLTDNTEMHSLRCAGHSHDIYNCKVLKIKAVIRTAIETAIKECDAHHKALRAKELGEIRKWADDEESTMRGFNNDGMVTHSGLCIMLDELIEKPV